MQDNTLCLCCFEEETAPVWKEIVIYHDFDSTGQEIDPIATGSYDLVGFEEYCSKCKIEFAKQRDAANDDDLPF